MSTWLILLCLLSLTLSQQVSDDYSHPDLLVQTRNGPVRGVTYTNETGDRVLNGWMGIPFAQKPINDLRFRPPRPVENWPETLIADRMKNSCMQSKFKDLVYGEIGVSLKTRPSEDCLYLNIWSPVLPKTSQLLPVMIWIHGGAFVIGSASNDLYKPTVLASEGKLILVSIQYRLSIFGFMYLNSTESPGNQGMLDQVEALKWIKENIELFGGDPNRITLFGESAGAASVNHHLLSPLSQDLFNSGIMQSGSSLGFWSILNTDQTSSAASKYDNILISLGCHNASLRERIECARYLNSEALLNGVIKYGQGLQISPIVDFYFMPDDPERLLAQGRFKKCPILLGVNKEEGSLFVAIEFPGTILANFPSQPQIPYSKFKLLVNETVSEHVKYSSQQQKRVFDAVLYRYSNWPNLENQQANLVNLYNIKGDLLFACPAVGVADYYANHNQSVFMYFFKHQSSQSKLPTWFGSIHTEEIQFVFGKPLRAHSEYTSEEKVLSRKMLNYWSNFARSANPNDQSLSGECKLDHWPLYQITNSSTNDLQRAYLSIDINRPSVAYNLRAEYFGFWFNYIERIIDDKNKYK